MYGPLHAMLEAAKALLLVGAHAYAEQLPQDAHAWAVMLAAGRVAPSLRIEMAMEGPRVQLGYVESSGAFHPFWSSDALRELDAGKLN
ncbi:MAG: hypothetical protein A3G81_26105 [Betaproteobacteria bacterium RIFCSPLOWO2_12_FULL_65_14]|nr:MAG: hypothetical protein A3G81_26105 [Betaproteobacteria bacterium RIFCSPLOWO2_12_FULL_65_14]